MNPFDDFKKTWNDQQAGIVSHRYDLLSFERMIKSRVKKHTDKAMQYFWSAFTLQIILYGLLGHLMIRYWSDGELFVVSLFGLLLQVPFTYMLMKKFKAIAITRPMDNSSFSLYGYIKKRHDLLRDFYLFKRNYERFLVPLSTLVVCYLVVELYLPGKIWSYWNTLWVIIVMTIITCAVLIRKENRENFEQPLEQYKKILDEFDKDIAPEQ